MSGKKNSSFDRAPLFIVGNSRSGTHLISRILGNHPDIYDFPHELHFFEELWTSQDVSRPLSAREARDLAARLISIHEDGYFRQRDLASFAEEARQVIEEMSGNTGSAVRIFEAFLFHEAKKKNKRIPCDHTPRNVFYLPEILEHFRGVHIINMIRDPRDILLSQKRKWRRRALGARNIPVKESVRSMINYHPVTISHLWNASIKAVEQVKAEGKVHSVYFEDLVNQPEETVSRVCAFIGIRFHPELLAVPMMGSSTEVDRPQDKGIRQRVGDWQKGGLDGAELYLCQKVARPLMMRHGYDQFFNEPDLGRLFFYFSSFSIKLVASFVLNLNRMKSVRESIQRRLA